MDEPKHPKFADYQYQHTKDWSATVSRADALVFVPPEYNKEGVDFCPGAR